MSSYVVSLTDVASPTIISACFESISSVRVDWMVSCDINLRHVITWSLCLGVHAPRTCVFVFMCVCSCVCVLCVCVCVLCVCVVRVCVCVHAQFENLKLSDAI